MGSLFPTRIPSPLAGLGTDGSAAAAIFNPQGRAFDVAISGVPFNMATDPTLPFSVASEEIRKDQFDNEQEPGEQSLSSWWRRSQTSWHEGAGALYQEANTTADPSQRFFESFMVDPWTAGEITLLRRPVQSAIAITNKRAKLWQSAADTFGVSFAVGNIVKTIPNLESTTLTNQRNMGKAVADQVISGSNYYALAEDGTLEFGPANGSGTVTTTWTMTSATTSADNRLRFAMFRLWIISGNRIYQPDLSGSGATAAIFAHPATGWKYTSIAEGANAVYFAGHDNFRSAIQMITLTAGTGAVPTLSGAITAALLPDGEMIQQIETMAGQFIGIGTNLGFRVGLMNENGTITYGPRFLNPPDVLECTAITTMERFFVVSFRSTGAPAKTYRIDTSIETDEGEFAWAEDVEYDASGWMNSLGSFRGRTFGTHSDGEYHYQHATELADTGFLTTGRIRFRTTEKKVFRFLNLEIEPLHGQIVVSGTEETGTSFNIHTFADQNEVALEQVRFPDTLGGQSQIALKFTLARDGIDATRGPVLNSYLVRALPAVAPRRVYQLPLLCFDSEMDRHGNTIGKDGFAKSRLATVQALEEMGEFVLYEDFSGQLADGRQCQIENTRFVQTTPPHGYSGWGGILIVTLKTVD